MKSVPAALQQRLESQTTTIAYALRLQRPDGQVFGFTSAAQSVVIGGVTYDATQGLDVSALVVSAGLAVDSAELRTLDDGTLFSHADVLGGRWHGTRFVIFRYDWSDPAAGTEPMMAGVIGEVRLMREQVVAELRGLQQYLQQPLGSLSTRTCRARFADHPTPVPSNRCGLNAASYTHAGSVTAVVSRNQFSSTLTAVSDYFGEGLLTWTTGANAGLRMKVAAYAQSGGAVTLMLPMPSDIAPGDQFSVVAGCRKRLQDCRDKFSNVHNFQGEPHRPTLDSLTAAPEVSA